MPTDAANRHAFPDALKRGLYEAIFRRRDIREFLSDPIPDDVLARVLIAAESIGTRRANRKFPAARPL